jgi:hypothetical protein
MRLCAGKALKIAAIRAIETCRQDKRARPPGPCHQLLTVSGFRILWTCSCGCASTWRCGPGQTVPSCLSTSLTDPTAADIAALATLNCEMLLLPCSRNSPTDAFTADEYDEAEATRLACLLTQLALVAVNKLPEPFVIPELLSDAIATMLVKLP